MKIKYIFFSFYNCFAMFWRKPCILILDLYLYGIKIQTNVRKFWRKHAEKSTIYFFKDLLDFLKAKTHFFLTFSMLLILDLYLYSIKIQTNIKPFLIKICRKINNIFKDFSGFFLIFFLIYIYTKIIYKTL
jgi:hypothetical protein